MYNQTGTDPQTARVPPVSFHQVISVLKRFDYLWDPSATTLPLPVAMGRPTQAATLAAMYAPLGACTASGRAAKEARGAAG